MKTRRNTKIGWGRLQLKCNIANDQYYQYDRHSIYHHYHRCHYQWFHGCNRNATAPIFVHGLGNSTTRKNRQNRILSTPLPGIVITSKAERTAGSDRLKHYPLLPLLPLLLVDSDFCAVVIKLPADGRLDGPTPLRSDRSVAVNPTSPW